jgi:septum formation protein
LQWAEIPFEVQVSDTDETWPEGMAVVEVPVHIAIEKNRVIHSDRVILSADTVVVLDEEIIGKPMDVEDAVRILQKLSGRNHQVITGVCIRKGDLVETFADITHVQFHELTEEQIRFYVEKYQPFDKAGAYAIQEWIGVTGIKSIEGDFYNVMGLPVSRVVKALEKFL